MNRSKWHFRPNTQDEFIYNEVYVENCYRLPDDMSGIVVIDVGANIGAFAVACLERGAERVICFEPDYHCYQLLIRHLHRFDQSRSTCHMRAVVGSNRQDAYMSYAPVQEGTGVLMTGGRHINSEGVGEKVASVTLDRCLPVEGKVWVKLDCEGSEHEILADNLPWDRIDKIFGEIHVCGPEANTQTLLDRLDAVGYNAYAVGNPNDDRLALLFAVQKEGVWVDVSTFADLPDSKKLFVSKENTDLIEMLKAGDVTGFQSAILEDLERESNQKTVCILTPFRNARRYLPLYFSQMASLQSALKSEGYRMRIVAAEGDSLDGTRERINQLAAEHGLSVKIVDTTHGLMRWASVEDPIRLQTMSDVMNKALGEVKESDDIVVWIMSDLKWDPQDILDLIQTAGHDETGTQDIYAPMVLTESGHFYDTWAFRLKGDRIDPVFPSNLDKFKGAALIGLDSAGTCLVMKAETALDCRAYKEEAVSFCLDAKFKRHNVWLDIGLKVIHAPLPSKRLLWISDAVCISGFSRVAHALFPLLVESGYDLDIIALNYFGDPHNFPYMIYPASVQGDDPSGNLRAKYLIYQASKEDRPYDLIIKLDDPWNVKGLVRVLESLEREYQVPSPPVLAWVTVDGKNIKGEELLISSIASVVVCTGFGATEIIRGRLNHAFDGRDNYQNYLLSSGISSPHLSTVEFGVDTSIFRPLDKVEARSLVSSSEIPAADYIVGVVSTNQLRKRLDLVLAYFSAWTTQYQVSNAYLYLCLGPDHNSGFDINSLKDYYGLKNRIIWNPHLLSDEALALVYNSFDVYLSLSQGEGFGLPALEAMACGVPCVLSDWSAYSSWVPESAAYKIPCTSTAVNSPSNAQSYVVGGVADQTETTGALQKLYMYPELREQMGQAGVEFAKGMSWKQTGDRLIVEIEQVIDRVSQVSSPMMAQAEAEGIR